MSGESYEPWSKGLSLSLATKILLEIDVEFTVT